VKIGPLGEGWCADGNHCPLHDQIQEIKAHMDKFLCENDFGGFRGKLGDGASAPKDVQP